MTAVAVVIAALAALAMVVAIAAASQMRYIREAYRLDRPTPVQVQKPPSSPPHLVDIAAFKAGNGH